MRGQMCVRQMCEDVGQMCEGKWAWDKCARAKGRGQMDVRQMCEGAGQMCEGKRARANV